LIFEQKQINFKLSEERNMLTKASPRAGRLVVQQTGPDGFSAFIPNLLPPDPPLEYDDEIKDLIEKANRALGRLDGATYMLPNPDLFLIYVYQKRGCIELPDRGHTGFAGRFS